MIKSHKKLSVDSVIKINRAIGMLFSMLELKMKFTKTFNRINELMQKNSISEKDLKEIEEIDKNRIEIKTIKSTLNKLE